MPINATNASIILLYIVDLFVIVPLYTKKKYDHSARRNKLTVKGIAIGIPLLMLLYKSSYTLACGSYHPFICMLTLGMLLCAFGDIYLEIRFFRGGCFFLAGHLVYVISVIGTYRNISWITIASFVILCSAGTYITVTKLDKKYRVPLLMYNLVISASFALGLTLVTSLLTFDVLLGSGLMLLVTSDWLLARNKLYGSNYKRSLFSLVCYFGGQILISSLVLFI